MSKCVESRLPSAPYVGSASCAGKRSIPALIHRIVSSGDPHARLPEQGGARGVGRMRSLSTASHPDEARRPARCKGAPVPCRRLFPSGPCDSHSPGLSDRGLALAAAPWAPQHAASGQTIAPRPSSNAPSRVPASASTPRAPRRARSGWDPLARGAPAARRAACAARRDTLQRVARPLPTARRDVAASGRVRPNPPPAVHPSAYE